MTEHTPGPWRTSKTHPENILEAREAPGRVVAFVGVGYPEEQWKANAHLIAAAPELLAALKDIASHCYQASVASDIAQEAIDRYVARLGGGALTPHK